MKLKQADILKSYWSGFKPLKSITFIANCVYAFWQYLSPLQVTKGFIVVLLFCSACGNKQSTEQPDIKFDRMKWNTRKDGQYLYRKQMVNDLLNNYQWEGVKKDSVIQMLGQADGIEEGSLIYNYEKKPFLGGLGTIIEAAVFELAADSTVKVARLNDGGWD
jgi:hypothetical protein